MIFSFIKKTVLQIPVEIRQFFKRAILIFIAWNLLYNLVLFPSRIPDRQLTNITARITAFLYHTFVDNKTQVSFKETINEGQVFTTVYLDHIPAVSIADPCNALGLYVLYISILFCFSAPLKRKIIYSAVGCAIIFIANGLRCFGLTWMYIRKVPWFSFAHHYLFLVFIYAVIFFMWVSFIKKLKPAATKRSEKK